MDVGLLTHQRAGGRVEVVPTTHDLGPQVCWCHAIRMVRHEITGWWMFLVHFSCQKAPLH
jgi:hypothetical protein